ncbi:MAG: MFS transporter [Parachlamydiaceae bacterium]|nr:MFS transporter [Parachlamydiaceae bacterium]
MAMLAVILYKEMHITPFQITVIIALKPISALFAPYWSLRIYRQKDRLISNIIYAAVLQYTPLLFFPWITSSWLIILAFGIYMMLNRGVMPTWMELFKRNMPPVTRENTFSYGSIVEYLGSVIVPVCLGVLLDTYGFAWNWLFPFAALLGLCSIYFLAQIPLSADTTTTGEDLKPLKFQLTQPMRFSWDLLVQRPDFTRFQIGFMLGGGGLMVMQPALPPFFVDVLQLSFTQMGIAVAAFKGVGFVLTAPFWAKLFRRLNIYYFSGIVTALAALFPLLLISSQYYLNLLCVAYLIYGVMQAGSELSWHMSGVVFAKDSDSTVFSSTNVLAVGIRGCFFPFLGSFLYSMTNATTVMAAGAILCVLATHSLLTSSRSFERVKST